MTEKLQEIDNALPEAKPEETEQHPPDGAVLRLEDGRWITQVPLKARDYFRFKAIVTKDVVLATHQLMLKMFLVDGKPFTIDELEDLDFEKAAVLDAILNAKFPNSQNP